MHVMLLPISWGLFPVVIFMHASSGWRVPSSGISVAGRQSLGSGCASGSFSNHSLGIPVDQRCVLRESEGKPLHVGIEVLCPLCPLTAHAAGGCPCCMWARMLGLSEHTRIITVRLMSSFPALSLSAVDVCCHAWAEGINDHTTRWAIFTF